MANITLNDTDGAYAGNVTDGIITYYLLWENGTVINTTVTSTNSDLINFTGLGEGTYIINSTGNDTLGNMNSTGESRTIVLDTTSPVAAATCTPSSIIIGVGVTCTCSASDALSGVASSTATSTPTTYYSGTYSYTCTATDYAGNSASDIASYTIINEGGTGSSGTTTSFWTKGTQTVTEEQFQNSYTKALQVRQRLKVKVETLNHYVGVTELTATTATISVESDPQEATLIVGDERMFEVSGDDYYDVLVKLNSIESSKANITVQSIHELITEDTTGAEEGLEDAGDAAAEEDEAAADEGSKVWWITGTIALVLVIVGIIFYKKKK